MRSWGGGEEFAIPDKNARAARRERQAAELERNQQDLRTSIAASERLVNEADALLRRHRRECDEAEKED